MIWSAFTFSEELGFEEGGHGGLLSPCIWNLVTSGWLVHPLTPFMVKQHLGNLLFIVIYTNLGLFAELSILLWFWLKAHGNLFFYCKTFNRLINPFYLVFQAIYLLWIHYKVAYNCKLLVLVIRLSLFTHQNGWRLPCEVKPSKTITIVI